MATLPKKGARVAVVGMHPKPFNWHIGTVERTCAEDLIVDVRLHCFDEDDGEEGSSRDGVESVAGGTQSDEESKKPAIVTIPATSVKPVFLPSEAPKLALSMDAPGSRAAMVQWLGSKGWGLPDEVAHYVGSFFDIQRASSVRCVGASSSRGDFALSAVLESDDSKWWISGDSVYRCGKGWEWLEFVVSPDDQPRRVGGIGVRIPVLPYGPLAVRTFLLHYCKEERKHHPREWHHHPHLFATLDRDEMQQFAILDPPIDATRIRLVCTMSAIGQGKTRWEPTGRGGGVGNCVGLFQVAIW